MFTKGQRIYRFKFDLNAEVADVVKHTFEIVDVKETSIVGKPTLEYKTKCLEDPKIKYKDGYFMPERCFDFDKAKPSGNYIYVLLEDDDLGKACRIVQLAVCDNVVAQRKKLKKAERELDSICNFINED